MLLLPRAGASRTLTHGDALHLIANARSLLPLRAGDERLALLPMCHVMERVLGLYLSLDARVISNYLENPDTAIENLQEVQPTVLATDPQIWQLLHARISNAAAGATPLQRMLYRGAIAAGARGGPAAMLARFCVLRAVRRELGLSRLRRRLYRRRQAGTRDRALGRGARHHHPADRRPGDTGRRLGRALPGPDARKLTAPEGRNDSCVAGYWRRHSPPRSSVPPWRRTVYVA